YFGIAGAYWKPNAGCHDADGWRAAAAKLMLKRSGAVGAIVGRLDDGKAQAHVPISFLDKKCKPIGACSGYSRASLFLPGHLIPTTFFNDFSSLPAAYFPEFFKFLFIVRLLHKLGDADRRLTRQDRLFGHRLGRAGGCPATPRKADDHCDDCPTNKAPHSILNLRCSLWLH